MKTAVKQIELQKSLIKNDLKVLKDAKMENHKTLKIIRYVSVNGKPAVKIYKGRSAKTISWYYYTDEAQRESAIKHVKKINNEWLECKARRRIERLSFVHSVNVGDIFVDSWGYDQTNVDFYQVIEVKGKYVVVREIAGTFTNATGPFSSNVTANKFNFIGEPKMYKVLIGNAIKTHSFSRAYLWDGRPTHSSWGH